MEHLSYKDGCGVREHTTKYMLFVMSSTQYFSTHMLQFSLDGCVLIINY